MSTATVGCMDPVTCPMCEGAIPGKEIRTVRTCPSCGADLSELIRRRLMAQLPVANPPPQSTPLIAQAALFSLLAPCLSIAVYLFGRRALSGTSVGLLVVGAVSLLLIAAGFAFGVVAFIAPKDERAAGKRVAGIWINGLLLSFAILSILTHPKASARGTNAPQPSRRAWSYPSRK